MLNRIISGAIDEILRPVKLNQSGIFSLYATFIDFAEAFNSVDHEALWKITHHYGISEIFISIIQASYHNSKIMLILLID